MSPTALADLFVMPTNSRRRIIKAVTLTDIEVPARGSSFFIHLSELCPVGCEHCMYASDLNPKSTKTSLTSDELTTATRLINESRSEKLNITGGGEPFLKFESICSLLRTVDIPRIEIVTAGYWGTTEDRARNLLTRLEDAAQLNEHRPDVLVRLSTDRFHVTAPNPVEIKHYANIIRAWSSGTFTLNIGCRSIDADLGTTDAAIAAELGGVLLTVNDWNTIIELPSGQSVPITYNVLRLSGKAASLDASRIDESRSIKEYYAPFETAGHRLRLATTVNDAIRRTYTDSGGAALTMNSDGTYWIFCGTAPDRRAVLAGQSFAESMRYFFEDPITVLLVEGGIWDLVEVVENLNPQTAHAAVARNDVACLVEDLLDDPRMLLSASIVAAARLVRSGRAALRRENRSLERLARQPEGDLVEQLRPLVAT